MQQAQHHRWMSEALREARKGLFTTHPNPRVGCLIVAGDEAIARGWHQFTGGPHAETNAIAAARIPAGADFYITLEPCSHWGKTPPCVDAVIACKPGRVIVAMQDPNPRISGRGLEKLRAAGIELITGILESEARRLNRGFVKRMQKGLPFLWIKMASSLDGRTALKNGQSKWITGEAARRDVQFLRAQSSAILSSAQTLLDDDPSLDLRLSGEDLGQTMAVRDPLRVLVDANLRLSGKEKIFKTRGEVLVYTLVEDKQKLAGLRAAGAEVKTIGADGKHVNLKTLLQDLAERGINEVHSECGPRLAAALIEQGLTDEIILYMAPHLLGSEARGMFDLGELTELDQRKNCKISDTRMVGDDLRLTVTLEAG